MPQNVTTINTEQSTFPLSLSVNTMFIQDNKKVQVTGGGGVLERLMLPLAPSGQVGKLQPTQSIKRCETYSENVSSNQ